MKLFLLFVSLALSSVTATAHQQPMDLAVAHRNGYNATSEETGLVSGGGERMRLAKRGSYSGRASYFAPGLGACGAYSSDSDFMVALNANQYGSLGAVSSWCFQTITVSYGGKSHSAKVLDACPGCSYGGLDMSPALFNYFADPSVGIFYMSWTSGGGDPAPAPAPAPTTPVYVAPEPTTTTPKYTPPPPTSTYVYVAPSPVSVTISITAAPLPTTALPLNSTVSSIANSTSLLNGTLPLSNGSLPLVISTNQPGGTLDNLSQLVLALGGLVSGAASSNP